MEAHYNMAKLTLSGLQTFAKTYVDASKQAGAWKETHNNLYKVLDKVGKMVMLDGDFNDKLPELSGDNLPLGKTIEEYMIDLTMPIDFKDPTSGTDFAEAALKPYLPTTEAASYSITLGRKIIPTTIPYDNVERGCINSSVAANMIAKISEKLEQSASLYRFQLKKQLLGNAAEKAIAATGLSEVLPAPTDATSGEKFIKTIKSKVEDASFANEGNCISKTLIGATPKGSLVLYVKKGVMPSLEVDTEAGAFNAEKIALPCTVKVLDDFGSSTNAAKINAILVDTRGVKLHDGYIATRAQENGFSDYVNIFKHSEYTGFISKYTYIRVFTQN